MSQDMRDRIQKGMGYTDQEFGLAMADPYRKKVLESGPMMVRRKIVGEVISAKNCAAHKTGAKYVVRGNLVVRPEDNQGPMCLSLLTALAPIGQMVFDRIALGNDPKGNFEYYVHCPDTGVECGGYGHAILKVTVE